jgi:hypothetical protein
MKQILKVVLAFLLSPVLSQAQARSDDWKNLEELKVGERIQVVKQNKTSHTGTFVALSEESVTLRTPQGDVGFRAEEVLRVSRLGPARRGRAALIGAAIGGVAGAVGLAAVDDNRSPTGFGGPAINRGQRAAIGGVVGGGLGAAVGAAVAHPAKTELYRASPAQKAQRLSQTSLADGDDKDR